MESSPKTLKVGNRLLSLEKPLLMGILNYTSDSFFDGGKYHSVDEATKQCGILLDQGADIIDLGANSSRPGSIPLDPNMELDALMPVVEALFKSFPDLLLSVDTFRAQVARECIQHGAQIINDISAGDDDPEMLSVIANTQATYIAMHKQGSTTEMQNNPQYEDVVSDVAEYFTHKSDIFKKFGIEDYIIDLGFGFGKTVAHNYELLHRMREFKVLFRKPILVGISRKSMINRVLGISPKDALNGTSVLNTVAVLNGADILRVHDVKEAREVVDLLQAYNYKKS
jgi:dihydropteroate synthase